MIRKRYHVGVENFFRLYRPLATTWRVYDNSEEFSPRPVGIGRRDREDVIVAPDIWAAFKEAQSNAT